MEHLHHLDASVAEVFSLMLNRVCAPAPACCTPAPGFTATIAFSGTLNGTCALHLAHASVGELTEDLTGEPPAPNSPLLADTLSELCNMIAGSWKSRLPSTLAACNLSVPTVTQTLYPPTPTTRAYRFATHCLTLDLSLDPTRAT